MQKTPVVKAADLPPEIAAELGIDPADIERELQEQPERYARWAIAAAAAQARAEKLKEVLDITEAEVDATLRKAAAEAGEKITEARLDQERRRHPEVVGAMEEYLEARESALVLAKVEAALKMRFDSIVQIGAHQRAGVRALGG